MAKRNPKTNPFRPGLVVLYLMFGVLAALVLAPMLMTFSKSVSSEADILSGRVGVLPNLGTAHLDAYRYVLTNSNFLTGLRNTTVITLFGTLVALCTTSLCAYTLSKPYLRGRRGMLVLCIFTMVFSGGLIPTYLVMTDLKLVNTFRILWMAGAFNVANMLILKTSFEGIPQELEEAATIDGAGHARILTQIYLPLSKAMLAVVLLYYAVDYWNNYTTSMYYTTKASLKSLQLVLKETIFSASDIFLELYGAQTLGQVTTQSTIAACVVVATVPILIAYPFVQKHFTKGIMIGAVKG